MIHREIEGNSVILRPVEETDAGFILSLRTDPDLSKYLHKVSDSLEYQELWIRAQREREGDYYFVIMSLSGEPKGVIRLSGFGGGSDHGEVGSFISRGNSVQNMEAELLMMDLAFDELGLDYLRGTTLTENIPIISYHKKFGYVYETEEKDLDGMKVYYGQLSRDDYYAHRDKVKRMLDYVER